MYFKFLFLFMEALIFRSKHIRDSVEDCGVIYEGVLRTFAFHFLCNIDHSLFPCNTMNTEDDRIFFSFKNCS